MVKTVESVVVKKYKFNLNKYMYIKLTVFGKQKILEKCGEDYFKVCIEGAKQPDGYYKLQAHEVFRQFGEYMVLWARPDEMPFELNVYFTDEDIEEVDRDEH